MNIVYLFNSSLPSYNANSLQVVNVCHNIAKYIGQITLITPNTGLKKTIFSHYGLDKNFKTLKIKYFNSFPRGLKYYLFSIVSIIYSFKLKPDFFITRNYFTLFLLILLRKKVIFEVHSSLEIEGRLINFIYNNFSIFNSKNLVNLIFITNSLKNFFYKKYKIKERKYSILPSSSNICPFIPRPQNNKKFKIGYFGYINKSRGFDFICNLSRIDNQNEYHVIGGTKSDINNYKKKFYSKNLFLKSYIPNREIKNYIKKMDLLILPYEKKVQVSGGVGEISKFTSPMKLFDYLASSKPIISSSLPVLNEILKNRKNCIFVNGLNIFRWRLVINKFLNSTNQRLIISKNNFNLFKNYTYKIRVKKMFNF